MYAKHRESRQRLSVIAAGALATLAALSGAARADQPSTAGAALSDPRSPYAKALTLVNKNRYDEAAAFTGQALAISAKNLDVWKLDIWLRLRNGEFDTAFDRVERLARFLPGDGATGRRRDRGDEIAHFFGEVCGYLIGPREDDVSSDFDYRIERLVAGFTPSQSSAFDRGLRGVVGRFATLNERIEDTRQKHIDAAHKARDSRMGEITLERNRLRGELASIDALRLKGMEIAANERNTLAATRETAAGGAVLRDRQARLAASDRAAFGYRGPQVETARLVGVGAGGAIAGESFGYRAPEFAASRFRGVEAYRGATDAASAFAVSKGFGTTHYRNVNDREDDYDTHLVRRRTSLMKQLRNLTREEKKLLGDPPTGDSTRIARMRRNAERLITYIPLPIDVEKQLRDLRS